MFNSNGDFYARPNAAAEAATASQVSTGTASELNPSVWDVTAGPISTIGLTSLNATVVTMAFYPS